MPEGIKSSLMKNNMVQESRDYLRELIGTYRGFSPSEESPIGLGELEVVVLESELKIRAATGIGIKVTEIHESELKVIGKEKLKEVYVEGCDFAEKTIGLEINGIKYLFLKDAGEEMPGLFILGSLGDYLGPTFCFSPEQIKKGLYQKAIDDMREKKMFFPTLENNGLMP